MWRERTQLTTNSCNDTQKIHRGHSCLSNTQYFSSNRHLEGGIKTCDLRSVVVVYCLPWMIEGRWPDLLHSSNSFWFPNLIVRIDARASLNGR